jgi:hypothetical protein
MNVIVGVRGLHDKALCPAAIESGAQASAFAWLEPPLAAFSRIGLEKSGSALWSIPVGAAEEIRPVLESRRFLAAQHSAAPDCASRTGC